MKNIIQPDPRNQCYYYVNKNGGNAILLRKKEFDDLFRKKYFVEGPFKETFGDGYGDPYNPNRQAFGKLKNKRVVYCELNPDMEEEVESRLEKIAQTAKDIRFEAEDALIDLS